MCAGTCVYMYVCACVCACVCVCAQNGNAHPYSAQLTCCKGLTRCPDPGCPRGHQGSMGKRPPPGLRHVAQAPMPCCTMRPTDPCDSSPWADWAGDATPSLLCVTPCIQNALLSLPCTHTLTSIPQTSRAGENTEFGPSFHTDCLDDAIRGRPGQTKPISCTRPRVIIPLTWLPAACRCRGGRHRSGSQCQWGGREGEGAFL